MKKRRRWPAIVFSGGALLGSAALYNALVQRRVPRLVNLLGGEEGSFRWRGHRIAFTKRGAGFPLLLVHGVHPSAWSYEWRDIVEQLAAQHTVFTIDLLGLGLSDRPAVRYSARLFISLISDFASAIIAEPCTLIGSGLSAGYAVVLGARDPHRFPMLALVAPIGLLRPARPRAVGRSIGRAVVDTPVVGTAMFNALVSRRSLRSFLERSYADDTRVTEELVEIHYTAAHQPGARYLPAAYLAGHLEIDAHQALRRLRQPTLFLYGEHGLQTRHEEARAVRTLKPDIDLVVVPDAGDLPHEERPEDFDVILSSWLRRLSPSFAPMRAMPHGTRAGSPPMQRPS